MTSELLELEDIVQYLPKNKTLLLDMKQTNKHWLVNYEYFFVRKDFIEEKLKTDTCFYSSYENYILQTKALTPRTFLQNEFEESIRRYWAGKFLIGKIDLLAWSKYTVEKDTGLCYIYDINNNFKGIYCHCMNRVDECIFVGKSLKDFFDLEFTKENLLKVQPIEDFLLCKKKLFQYQLLVYDKVLKKDEYAILDSEIGTKTTLSEYDKLIRELLIPLSKYELQCTALQLITDKDYLLFLWFLKERSFDIKVDNKSDYVDFKIYGSINKILESEGLEKKFVVFKDYNFGQEYGVAYIDLENQRRLESVTTLTIIKL